MSGLLDRAHEPFALYVLAHGGCGHDARVQGVRRVRDALADMGLLREVVARLPQAGLSRMEEADHAFRTPARTGRSDAEVLAQACDLAADWMRGVVQGRRPSGGPPPGQRTPT